MPFRLEKCNFQTKILKNNKKGDIPVILSDNQKSNTVSKKIPRGKHLVSFGFLSKLQTWENQRSRFGTPECTLYLRQLKGWTFLKTSKNSEKFVEIIFLNLLIRSHRGNKHEGRGVVNHNFSKYHHIKKYSKVKKIDSFYVHLDQ